MKFMNRYFEKMISFSSILGLSLVIACGSDPSSSTIDNSAPKISINNFNCQSDPNTNSCRDISLLSIEYQASDDDNNLETVIGKIESIELNLSQDMQLVAGKLQASLSDFSGANDVLVKLIATDIELVSTTVTENIGSISVNSAPVCSAPLLNQNFVFGENGGSVTLIDITTCNDQESDSISLSNQTLNTEVAGDYSNTVIVLDEYGLATNYIISGNVAQRNLTITEFTNQLIATPNAVGADLCFLPINPVFDEAVVCGFGSEWLGFQYDSIQDTSFFSNIAPIDSAQGFTHFTAGPSLNEIVATFTATNLPDNQAVAIPGTATIVITANIERDLSGNYTNSVISGEFTLQGSTTENTNISCENQTYILPISTVINSHTSTHTIDQIFVENLAQTQRISNCVSINNNGIQTILEGDIDIVVTDLSNQNPIVNSVTGITQGFEGIRTVVTNVTDLDNNLSSVQLRYRIAGSGSAWTEISLTQQGATDNYSASETFDYASNLNDDGTIEFQVVALDSFGGQGTSSLTNTLFFANENTAQNIIESEIASDFNKSAICFDCTFMDAMGNAIGSFDALYSDLALANHSYEYNGEQRSAAAMVILANSVVGTNYDFHEVPIGTVANIKIDIQNN